MLKSHMKTVLITSSLSRVFTLNSFHKALQSTKLMMWQYLSDYLKLCLEKGQNFGPVIGFPPANKAFSVKLFLAQIFITEMDHPPCSLIWPQMTSGCFPEIKSALKG